MTNYSIYHDLCIKGRIDKIFDAITNPEHLINWWPLYCTGTPETGEIYNLNFTDDYDWYGKVIKVEANKSFHIKMTKSDENWNHTSFGFDLENSENGVVLKFQHTGWLSFNDEYRQSSYCWAILLQGLKNYIENNVIIPFEKRA